jgi:hypothetical protein
MSAASNGGTYTVTVTDANGCTDSATQTININNPPTANNATLEVCENTHGGNIGDFILTDADSDVNASGGITISYHATSADAMMNTNPLSTAYQSTDGTIYARVTDATTGCYATSTITLTVNPLPTGVEIQNVNNGNSPLDFTICEGDPINLVVAGTGSGTLQYDWTLPGGTSAGSPLNVGSADFTQHNGPWTVTVTDGNGCTATDNITITVTQSPANDDCEVANIDLGSGGSAAATNNCAGPDYSLNCASTAYEASVWFTVTVDAGNSGIEFTVTGTGSDPMTGSGAGTLAVTGCGTTAVGEGCFTVGAATQILCIPPGTYNLQIATSSANAGDFNISVSQITGGPSAPGNDLCDNATAHALVACEPVTISGNNTNACDELFSIGGCNFGTDPTTWHTITIDANATSIDITNITGGAYLGIFESSPCGSNSPSQLPGAGCVTSNTTSVPVTGGATYYIAVGHASGTAYSFAITENVPPPNDTPCTAETIGTATQNTTCCANQEWQANVLALRHQFGLLYLLLLELYQLI